VADRGAGTRGGLSGRGLRDLLSTGIAGLESVPAVRPTPPPAALPPIDHFLLRGPAALAAARQLAARMAQGSHPPTPAEVSELQDLLRLADEG
jgi:hypothetical protein